MPTQSPEKMEEEKDIKQILDKTEISLVLDTYDDIFSDFDPRPYNERALSEDFLVEAKRAAIDKGGGIELRFLIPKSVKNTAHEELIKQRLKDHFKKHYRRIKADLARYKKQAGVLIVFGMAIGFGVVSVSLMGLGDLITNTVTILGSPASWYTIWTGFDHLMFKPEELRDEEIFYKKFLDCHVSFTPY